METTLSIKRKNRLEQALSFFVLTIISILIILPILYMLSIALSDETDIVKNGYSLLPRKVSFSAFKQIFAAPDMILRSYFVTIIATVAGTFCSLMMTAAIAYVVSRKDFKYKKSLSIYLFFPLLFNGGMVAQYLINTQVFHLNNTIFALFLPYGVNVWYAFMMKGFMTNIPFELIESAKIDGANEFTTYFKIVLPLAKSAMATIGLFYAFAYWNDWWLGMMYITKNELVPLQYMLQRIMQNIEFYTTQMPAGIVMKNAIPIEGLRMALAIVAAGPMLVVFPFFQKYFVKGIAVGSVKG